MSPERATPRMFDIYIKSKSMYPFWVFADIHKGKYCGGAFMCFIGAHYEAGLVSENPEAHNRAVERLKSGSWKLSAKQEYNDTPDKKIGWGVGGTPTEAFQNALKSSAYMKIEDTTKSKS